MTTPSLRRPVNDGYCFVCGPANPVGLRLRFEPTPDGVRAVVSVPRELQGWQGIVHGGIVATLLDEALAYAAVYAVGPAVTAELTVRLRAPCPVETPLVVTGRIHARRRRLLEGTAEVRTLAGDRLAVATGRLFLTPEAVLGPETGAGETTETADGAQG